MKLALRGVYARDRRLAHEVGERPQDQPRDAENQAKDQAEDAGEERDQRASVGAGARGGNVRVGAPRPVVGGRRWRGRWWWRRRRERPLFFRIRAQRSSARAMTTR